MRRVRGTTASRLALAGLAAYALGCSGPATRPDLLLITIDTLRPDRLACYGGDAENGASLCGLAAQGTRFVWAFSTAPTTPPSVASILTSRYPRDHRVVQAGLSAIAPELTTVAEVLRAAGYTTAAFVANPTLRRRRGFHQGFEIYDDQMTHGERNRPQFMEREAGELTDTALAYLRTAKRPWFVWVHYQDPHGPYEAPDAPPPADAPGAARLPVLADHSGWKGIPAYQVLGDARSVPAYEHGYQQEIRWFDRNLERLIRAVDARAPRPGVLLGADHGEAFGEDEFYFAHGHSVALDQIHVPLLWRPPGAAAGGTVITRSVSNLDIAPTLLAAAGVAAPPEFAGRPLPTRADAAAAERVLFAEHPLRIAAIAGPFVFARDRHLFKRPASDAVSGGLLPPLPPRLAHLGVDGRAELRDDPGLRASLDRRVADFMAQAGAAAAPATSELDPETRDALRALGYLE